jgi:hypothetical protein
MFDVDAKEMKGKKQQLWKELLLYLESSWVDVEELEIVGKLLKKAFLILLRRRKLCSHWPECNKSNDGNSTTIL